jgi:hypothetical protein
MQLAVLNNGSLLSIFTKATGRARMPLLRNRNMFYALLFSS